MKIFMFIITMVTLAVVATGCGDPRTQATLRSPEDIKAITDTFIVGQTTITDVYNALGPWVKASDESGADVVTYWTNDGGETKVTFGATCPTIIQGNGCFASATHTN